MHVGGELGREQMEERPQQTRLMQTRRDTCPHKLRVVQSYRPAERKSERELPRQERYERKKKKAGDEKETCKLIKKSGFPDRRKAHQTNAGISRFRHVEALAPCSASFLATA